MNTVSVSIKSTKILKIHNKKSKNLGKNIMADPEHLG